MNWERLKKTIYYWDGSWRDIYVKNTNNTNWKNWVNMVNDHYKIRWFNAISSQTETKIDFEVINEYWEGNKELVSTANIFLDQIQINTHFFSKSEIEHDIDPREFRSIEDHYKLIDYLKKLSKICEKEVIVTLENSPEHILMRIKENEIHVN